MAEMPDVRHIFGEPGLRVTWYEGPWAHEVHLVPGEDETVRAELTHRRRRDHDLPRGGMREQDARTPTEGAQWKALASLGDMFERAPAARVGLELAGFTRQNLWPPIRPRGQPRTPDLVYAAVAVLCEQTPSRPDLAERLTCSTEWVKKRARAAHMRGLLDDGPCATDSARRLLESDGRDPAAIIAMWFRDRAV